MSTHTKRASFQSWLALVAVWLLSACSAPAPPDETRAGHAPTLTASTSKPFQDVVDELEFAISEHNFRITGRNSVGAGIRARGYPSFPDLEVIHFCSLEYAREVLEMDPAFAAEMPCRVIVRQAKGRVIMTMILLPSDHPDPRVNAFANRMNGILREIVAYVLEADVAPNRP